MNKKQKRRRKILIGRVYDLLIIPVYIILSLLILLALKNYTTKFLLLIALILGLILAIFIVTFAYNKKSIEYTRRIIITILCVLLAFGYGKVHSINSFLSTLTNAKDKQYITTEMHLLSLQSSDVFTAVVEEYEDIEGKKVAINTMADKNASSYVQKELNKKFKNIEYVEYSDYANMMTDLFYGYVDVVCFNTSHKTTMETTWGPLEDFTTNTQTFTYKEKLKSNRNEKNITKEVFTVLVSANDELGAPANYSKSDANLLLMVNPNTHQLITVSIPRDSYIGNPAYDYMSDKLTHTGNNGADNTRKAVEEALGIDVDFYVKVSFSSLIEIVDTLGKIEVDVPITFCEQDENRSFAAEDEICLYTGVQKLDGREALAFARHRYSYVNQDLGRNQAQMKIIKAIIKKLITPEGISKVEDILEIMPSYVLTNFSNGQIQSFIKSQMDDLQSWSMATLSLAKGITDENIVTASMPNVGTSVYYLNKNEVYALQSVYKQLQENTSLKEFNFTLDDLYQGEHAFKEGKNTVYYDPTLYY